MFYSIKTSNDFKEIISQYKKIYGEEIVQYKTVRILEDTYKQETNFTLCEIEIEYKNNQILRLIVEMSSSSSDNIIIQFKNSK